MRPKIHIASCSFGKDSIATILLALENKEPLDRVVFSDGMTLQEVERKMNLIDLNNKLQLKLEL